MSDRDEMPQVITAYALGNCCVVYASLSDYGWSPSKQINKFVKNKPSETG